MLLVLLPLASAFDHSHAALQAVLSARLSGGRVDYAAIKADPATLDRYLTDVSAATVQGMTAPQQKAFWIDAYNALTIDLVADSYPLDSILSLDAGKVWDSRRFPVAGASRTLNDIEHRLLRPLGDPRIHAALNCASVGCPPLQPKVFLPDTLDTQLDAASAAWVASTKIDGKTVTVSKIFDWYGDDFVPAFGATLYDVPGVSGKEEAALNFVARHAPSLAPTLRQGGLTVVYQEYDWSLNRRP